MKNVFSALFLSVVFSSAVAGQSFTEGDLANGSASDPVGQSFVAGLEPTPDPFLSEGDLVNVDSVLFASGGAGFGSSETSLVILPGAFYDFDGEDGTFVPTIADTLGISDNTIDTTALAYGDPIEFTFTDLQIGYLDVVSAVFVTVNDVDEITPIAISAAFILFVEDPAGEFNPFSNYCGADNFDATSLFADADQDGFLQGAESGYDLSFTASFSAVKGCPFAPGDINEDGSVDLLDVASFVDLLTGEGELICQADLNGDEVIDLLDVAPFVAALSGG
ncbi:MAG: hypothetical protein AAGA30_10505 [Planctomycetota bacterium]